MNNNLFLTVVCALTSSALSVVVAKVDSVQAAIVGGNFSFTLPSYFEEGPNAIGTGDFTFDDAELRVRTPGNQVYTYPFKSFTLNLLGQTYNLSDLEQSSRSSFSSDVVFAELNPPLPPTLDGLSFVGIGFALARSPKSSLLYQNIIGQFFSIPNSVVFTYKSPSTGFIYNDVSQPMSFSNLRPIDTIPTPGLLPGLTGLGLAMWSKRRTQVIK
jgi:hypothetical protein